MRRIFDLQGLDALAPKLPSQSQIPALWIVGRFRPPQWPIPPPAGSVTSCCVTQKCHVTLEQIRT
jgi:hypothetical protein